MSKTLANKKSTLLYIAMGLIGLMVVVVVGNVIYRAFLQTGVKGSVIVVEGNCMPGPSSSGQCASESQNTRKMDVSLYQSISKSDDGSLTPQGRVAETRNVTNSYSLNAKPGKYYLFYRYSDINDITEYCAPVLQTTHTQQEPCEVTVPNTGMANVNITFNLVTY